jgi:hypothetical protein
MALDGGNEQVRVVIPVDEADIGDDTALGFLNPDERAKLGWLVEFAATKNAGIGLEDAQQLAL